LMFKALPTKKKKEFSGRDTIDWLVKNDYFSQDRSEATKFCEKLRQDGYLHMTGKGSKKVKAFFLDDPSMYYKFDKKKEKAIRSKKTKKRPEKSKKDKFFRVSLNELFEREGEVPSLIAKTIDFLVDTRAIEMEGILRVSGLRSELNECIASANAGQDVDFAKYKNPHLASDFLHTWLRELPEPLFPVEIYHRILSLQSLAKSNEEFVEVTKKTLAQLPPPNYKVLQVVLGLCSKILEASAKNKMQSIHIASAIAPNLLKHPSQTLDQIHVCNAIIASMIGHYSRIFSA